MKAPRFPPLSLNKLDGDPQEDWESEAGGGGVGEKPNHESLVFYNHSKLSAYV
jgi:hypothetical protein